MDLSDLAGKTVLVTGGSRGIGAAIVFGMSNNRRIRIAHPNWEAVGFRPQDDAEDWRDRLAAEGVDVDGPLQWSRHGGAYEARDH